LWICRLDKRKHYFCNKYTQVFYAIHAVHVPTSNIIQNMYFVIHHLWYISTTKSFVTEVSSRSHYSNCSGLLLQIIILNIIIMWCTLLYWLPEHGTSVLKHVDRSWYMSQMVYHRVRMLDDTLTHTHVFLYLRSGWIPVTHDNIIWKRI
jgi:archaellum biogenesis protein FlaJ (TadC family)